MPNKPNTKTSVPLEFKKGNIAAFAFVKCPLELLYFKPLSSNALRLYLCLLGYCYGDKRECWPSQDSLAALLQTTKRSVQRWLDELESLSFIEVGLNSGKSSTYFLPNLADSGKLKLLPTTQESHVPTTQESHVPTTQESHESDLKELDLKRERETGPGGVCLPENPDSPEGDIAQSSQPGYVALIELGFNPIDAERWMNYADLDSWIALAKTKNAPAYWLLTCFKNKSQLPKSRDSHQGRPRAAIPPTPAPTTAPAPTEPEEEIEWLIPAPDCEITGCSNAVVMMHRCKLHLAKKYGGLADD